MIDDLKRKIKEKKEKDLFNNFIKDGLDKIHKAIKNTPAPKESVEISNFPEQIKSIKVDNLKDIKPKDEIKISNPEDFKVKKVEVKKPYWFSLKGIIGEIKSLTKALEKKETNLDRYTRKDKPLAVKLVSSRRGGGFYDALGGGGGNKGDGNSILAKEAKQDDMITAINNVSGLQRSTDLEGGGKIAVGTTAVEVIFTGTPTESIVITADKDNTGVLYIGKSDVASDGSNALTFLEAGDVFEIDYDDSTNAIYVVANVVSQNFWKGTAL